MPRSQAIIKTVALGATVAELPEVLAGGGEDLDATIAAVRHVDEAVSADGNLGSHAQVWRREIELAVAGAGAAPGSEQAAVA